MESGCLLTFARLSIFLQDVAPRTGALVAPFSILADKVAGFWGLGTFIKI